MGFWKGCCFITCVVAMQVTLHLYASGIFKLQVFHAMLFKDFGGLCKRMIRVRWVTFLRIFSKFSRLSMMKPIFYYP